jgi:Polyprenyl synthetase
MSDVIMQSPSQLLDESVVLIASVEDLMLQLVLSGYDTVSEYRLSRHEAAVFHLRSGGHRVRAQLTLFAGRALGLGATDATVLAATVELMHNASLVHDDLQDREAVRRGAPAVWAAYGSEVAVCTGDLLLSAAYGALSGFSDCQRLPRLLALIHERTSMVIRGQCAELTSRGKEVNRIAEYENIVIGKSGALLSLPLEMVLLAAGESGWMSEARRAAEAFAISYQILDDLEDFDADVAAGPGFGCANILSVLKAGGPDSDAVKVARELGLGHLETALKSADRLPNGSGAFLRELAVKLQQRLLNGVELDGVPS